MHQYTWSHPIFVILLALGFILFAILVYEAAFHLRRITPKKVKCWFCHSESLVPYDARNSWVCDRCDQYNGFNEDGDYNNELPLQSDSRAGSIRFTFPSPGLDTSHSNRLCNECNLKQQLKVQALASFVPINEKNFDKEVEHFEKQLDKGFQLCQKCDMQVAKVLRDLRNELSLPKKLTAAVAKIQIKGEQAIMINILLSVILVISSFSFHQNLPFPFKLGNHFNQSSETFLSIKDFYAVALKHPATLFILKNIVKILIGFGVSVNSIAFYQTNSPFMFLNIFSWVLMFVFSLYPNGYSNTIIVLKVISSLISIGISTAILISNRRKKTMQKPPLLAKRQHLKSKSAPLSTNSNVRGEGCRSRTNTPPDSTTQPVGRRQREKSPFGISTGMSGLNLGLHRRSLNSSPTNFNPFKSHTQSEKAYPINTSKFSQSFNSSKGSSFGEKSFCFGRLGFSPYEPPLSPRSSWEGLDSGQQTGGYSPPPPYYQCTPTLAYYFTSQQCPKFSPPPVSPPVSKPLPESQDKVWTILSYLPTLFLVGCNLFLCSHVYFNMPTKV